MVTKKGVQQNGEDRVKQVSVFVCQAQISGCFLISCSKSYRSSLLSVFTALTIIGLQMGGRIASAIHCTLTTLKIIRHEKGLASFQKKKGFAYFCLLFLSKPPSKKISLLSMNAQMSLTVMLPAVSQN